MQLREARQARLMTLRDLAETSGVGATTIHGIETSLRKPTFKTIKAISAALGVEPREIDEFRAVIEDLTPRMRKEPQ